MSAPLPPRSYLFVPGNRPERFDKALAAGADAVIVDLEDAVPPAEKDAARATVAGWLAADRPVVVRINGPDTEWFGQDLALARRPGIAAIMLPKAQRIEDIRAIVAAGSGTLVLALIETAGGFANVHKIASVPGVARLVFGSIDFQLDLGIRGEDEELLYFRSQLVLVSRLAGIAAPVDGVSTAIDDAARLEADAARARRLGFGAKLCIHPRQVASVNRAFSPTDEEIAWARRVLDAAAKAGGAAVAVDGRMVDKPVILRAEAMVREAEARQPAGGA